MIFENGYLKSEFINPEYVSTSGGWETSCGNKIISKLKAQVCYYYTAVDRMAVDGFRTFKIKQFKPSEIPIGELCWFNWEGTGWFLIPMTRQRQKSEDILCVPSIIAKDEEQAEKLKGWANE